MHFLSVFSVFSVVVFEGKSKAGGAVGTGTWAVLYSIPEGWHALWTSPMGLEGS